MFLLSERRGLDTFLPPPCAVLSLHWLSPCWFHSGEEQNKLLFFPGLLFSCLSELNWPVVLWTSQQEQQERVARSGKQISFPGFQSDSIFPSDTCSGRLLSKRLSGCFSSYIPQFPSAAVCIFLGIQAPPSSFLGSQGRQNTSIFLWVSEWNILYVMLHSIMISILMYPWMFWING